MLVLNILILFAIAALIVGKKTYSIALSSASLILCYSIVLLIQTQPSTANFIENNLLTTKYLTVSMQYSVGLDGISLLFIILSTLLTVLCTLASYTIKYRKRLFFILLFVTELGLVNVFSVTEIIYFYILFEAILIPMFMIIGIYGSRQEKISAAYHFFLYTLIGSLVMLTAILALLVIVGSTNIQIIKAYQFSPNLEILFWLSFFASLSVKIPMFPFHLWLPKAHVEAPTAGSVLLAGILLKLGSYGFLRFSLFLFPVGTEILRPFITLLAIIGVVYSSFTILRQIDLKRVVAYSSVAHMSFVILGCFSGTVISLNGAILLMLAHGFVSAGLFLAVGYLYDRYKSRNLLYYRGLVNIMPIYTITFFFLLLANLGFPPTLNFVSELLILAGLAEANLLTALLSTVGILFAGISGFWVYTRIFFGNFVVTHGVYYTKFYYDITRREAFSIIPLLLPTVICGLSPNTLLDLFTTEVAAWGY
jgi:proton-translocating NADH-quinone oxidoreductase chain M